MVIDFEYFASAGGRPQVVCLVARELWSGRVVRVSCDKLLTLSRPPYPTGPDSLIVAYYASAELGCHLALGWPMPDRVLDLYVEFRNATNGRPRGMGMDCSVPWPIRLGRYVGGRKERDAGPGNEWWSLVRSRTSSDPRLLPGRCRCPSPAAAGCCRISTCRAQSCGAGTWRRRPGWSTRAYPSTSRR